jgi:hypothetical protein
MPLALMPPPPPPPLLPLLPLLITLLVVLLSWGLVDVAGVGVRVVSGELLSPALAAAGGLVEEERRGDEGCWPLMATHLMSIPKPTEGTSGRATTNERWFAAPSSSSSSSLSFSSSSLPSLLPPSPLLLPPAFLPAPLLPALLLALLLALLPATLPSALPLLLLESEVASDEEES